MSIFKQKRKEDRKELIYYLELSEKVSGNTIGRIVDITTGGILMISETPADVGKVYDMVLQLPEKIDDVESIPVKIRCVRIEKDPHSHYHYSGYQFRDLEPPYPHIIEELISHYQF
jgi:c-di-GMP-binding flagellar brake protein YcgR